MRRTLVAAVASASAFFVMFALLRDASQEWLWTASTFIGGAALIVQYLVDFGARLETVDRRFAEVATATELFSEVDGSVLRSDGVNRLVQGYARVREQGGGLARSLAERELSRLAELVEGLGNGGAELPDEDREWLIALTDGVRLTVDAVSSSVDGEFWHSGPGQRFLAAQERAIARRGVEVRHLFVVRAPEEVTKSLTDLCASHRRHGIDSRIAVRPLTESDPGVHDFIVFDGELSYEVLPSPRSRPAGTWLRTQPQHVEGRVRQFDELWGATLLEYPSGSRSLPARLPPTACRLRLTLLDDHPAPGVPARIVLRVEPGPRHPWSEPGADRPELTAVVMPLTPALIDPVSVSLRPSPARADGEAQVLFTPQSAGAHRIRVTVHDRATGTVLQQAETTVDVAAAPAGPLATAPSALRPEGE